ncbi:hypothetical protein MGI18_26855 [Bacillus sp. OVS6]|nr:hypothetical protein MGI18_26855 [Bacillus sp. OVS6]
MKWLVMVGAFLFILIGLGNLLSIILLPKKPLIFLGKISCSLYLYHSIVLFSLIHTIGDNVPILIVFVIAVFVAIALSAVAYYIIEEPSARIRKYLANEFINQ